MFSLEAILVLASPPKYFWTKDKKWDSKISKNNDAAPVS